MRIVLPREEFLEAVGWTARILPAKPYTPVLGGIYIVADDGDIHFGAYDTEVSAEVQVKGTILEDGEALVSGRLLAAISKVLPKQDVELSYGINQVQVRCGNAEFTLPTMPVQAYPKLPEVPEAMGTVAGSALAEAVAQVLPATSTDQAVPQLCAVYVDLGQRITLYATDKHRVAVRTLDWHPVDAMTVPARLLVPSRAIGELASLGNTESVFLGFDEATAGTLGIRAGKRSTTTRLIDSPFPNCKAILPKTHDALAVTEAEEMAGAMHRALLLDPSEFPRVHIAVGDNGIQFQAGSADGRITDRIPGEFHGVAQQFWCSPRYLLDAVAACRSKQVILGLGGHMKPITVAPFAELPPAQPIGSYGWHGITGDYLHVVMPVLGPTA